MGDPVDRLLDELGQLKLVAGDGYRHQGSSRPDAGVVVDLDFDDPAVAPALPHLLDAFVASAFNSYSLWSTNGSERVEPCVFVTPAMPAVAGAAAMLDGLWEDWEWSVPVRPLRADV